MQTARSILARTFPVFSKVRKVNFTFSNITPTKATH